MTSRKGNGNGNSNGNINSLVAKPTNRDRIAWALATRSYSDEDIRARLHITEDDLILAKLRMQAHIASVSHDVVDMVVNEEILSVARSGGIKRALKGAMSADRVLVTRTGVVMDPNTNAPLTVPDHDTRLEAVRTLSTLSKNLRPTSPAIGVNLQVNQNNTQNNLVASGRSFEARRRAAAERRGAVAVADAVVVGDEVDEAEEDVDEIEEEIGNEAMDGENLNPNPNPDLDDPDAIDDDDDDEGET
jgi:hypothetical protein